MTKRNKYYSRRSKMGGAYRQGPRHDHSKILGNESDLPGLCRYTPQQPFIRREIGPPAPPSVTPAQALRLTRARRPKSPPKAPNLTDLGYGDIDEFPTPVRSCHPNPLVIPQSMLSSRPHKSASRRLHDEWKLEDDERERLAQIREKAHAKGFDPGAIEFATPKPRVPTKNELLRKERKDSAIRKQSCEEAYDPTRIKRRWAEREGRGADQFDQAYHKYVSRLKDYKDLSEPSRSVVGRRVKVEAPDGSNTLLRIEPFSPPSESRLKQLFQRVRNLTGLKPRTRKKKKTRTRRKKKTRTHRKKKSRTRRKKKTTKKKQDVEL